MERKHKITAQTNCKLFLAMLYAIMTVFFFGCQKKEAKKPEITSLEAGADTSTTKSDSLDRNLTKKTFEQAQSPTLKVEKINLKKTTPPASNEVAQSDKAKKEDAPPASKPPVNTNAEFPGGIEQFHNFFMKEYKKPENVNYWKLNFTLAFAVEKNGSVSFLECSPAVEEPLEKEIIRVLSLCPKWQPGESNGKKTRMQYSVPILLK